MTKKKKCLIALAVLLAVLVIAAVSAIATTSYGTKSDPLVTLSYLNNTVKNDVTNSLNTTISTEKSDLTSTFNSQVKTFTSDINSKISNNGIKSTNDTFSVVTLSNGQTLTCSAGTEIMLRIGTAVSKGSDSPILVDTTTGESMTSSGSSLTTNHLYMVTIKNNGIKATASTVRVLVRGEYTIS